MRLFRSRRVPEPRTEAFARASEAVEAAQRSLLAAIPTSRDEGVPLGQALKAFNQELATAESILTGWPPELGTVRAACEQALVAARREATRLRLEPADLGFEALNARVADVLEPLEAFADAERTILSP